MGSVKDMWLEEQARRLNPDLSNENENVREMVEWFLANHEDPVENCPWDDGEYLFIYGGPYNHRERLDEHFEGKSEADIARASEILDNCEIDEWSGKPTDDDFEDDSYQDDPETEP